MSGDVTLQTKASQSGSGKGLAIAVLSFIYTVVNNFTEDLSLFGFLEDTVTIGIFVPAASSIIFGRGIGAISGGIGEILVGVTDILQGEVDLEGIHLGTLISSASIGIGAWLTGFLGKENTKEEVPDDFRSLLTDLDQFKKIGTDILASIVGLAITRNLIYAYGSQFMEGASLEGGNAIFLQYFISDSLALLFILPFTLLGFDFVQVFIKKRDKVIEALLLDIEKKVEEENGIEIVNVSLPKGILVQGKWTLVNVTFKNVLDKAQAFHLDAVSTSRMYPDTDNTSVLQPGSTWVQSFYVLPSKQKTVNMRVRITPKTEDIYREVIEHKATVEINAKTKDPSNMTASLLGFGGVNFGIVGISSTWDRIVAVLGEPSVLFEHIVSKLDLIITTVIAEILLFVPLILYMYRNSKKELKEGGLKLGFTRGFDYEGIQSRATGMFERLKKRYQGRLKTVIMGIIGLASVLGVGFLGYEAVNILTVPNYEIRNPNMIFFLSSGLLATWIFGVRGGDLINVITGGKSPWEFDSDNVITKFEPSTPFQINTPTEVVITARNITDKPGIRLVFQGFDSISPQVMELHLDPGEEGEFKIAVTPLKKEFQDILAIAYPLFDKEFKYIDANEAEPFAEQEIQYEVAGQTSLGITKDQQDVLKKGVGAGGFIAIAYTFIANLSGGAIPQSFDQFIAENGVIFTALQTPFLYMYFYFNNKFKNMV